MHVAFGYILNKEVFMAKLGQQIQAQKPTERLSRTQRVQIKREREITAQKQKKDIEDAQSKLSNAESLEEYEKIYSTLTPFQQSAFKSPEQIKQDLAVERQSTISKIDEQLRIARERQQAEIIKMGASDRTAEQEKRADARVQFYEGQIQGLQKVRARVEGGENLTYDQALDYANALGESRESRRREKLARGKEPEAPKPLGTFTGVVRQFQVVDGKEELVGARFFVKGVPATYKDFSQKVNVAEIEKRIAESEMIRQESLAKQSPEQIIKVTEMPAQQQAVTLFPGKVTRTDLAPKGIEVGKIMLDPYLERRPVDRFYDKETGKYIPVTKIFFVDPTVEGKQFEREATPEEADYFRSQTDKVLQASTEPVTFKDIAKSKIIGGYETFNKRLKEGVEEPITRFETFTGFGGYEEREKRISQIEDPTERFLQGAGSGLLEDIKQKPLKNIALFGAGALIGGITSGIVAGVSSGTTALLGQTAGRSATLLTKTALAGTAVYFGGKYALGVYGQVVTAPTAQEKGAILAINLKDFALIAGGSAVGAKAEKVIEGYFATRGRKEIPIEEIVPEDVLSGKKQFVGAKNVRQEFALTKDSPYKLPGQERFYYRSGYSLKRLAREDTTLFGKFEDPSGIYHATATRFSTKEPLAIQPGTSELPGLYGTYAGNIRYLRLAGRYTLIPKDYFTQPGKPAFEYLIPKGYRVNPAKAVSKYFVEGGAKGGYRYGFTQPVKEGFADLPIMKLPKEAEAVIRPGSATKGQYLFQSGEYYTTLRGVRIPIDVFRYIEGSQVAFSKAVVPGAGGYGGSSSSALFLPSYSLINPESIVFASLYSKKKSSQPSSARVSSLKSIISSIVSSGALSSYSLPGSSGSASRTSSLPSSLLSSSPFIPPPSSPIISPPISPPISPAFPALPDFDLQFFEEVRKKARRKKQGKDLAYVQDFTSKVVGFKPIEVSEKEAVKLAQKVQTGFELRAPIVVRRNNKDEKRLKKLLSQ